MMSYLTAFLIGAIGGLVLSVFLTMHASRDKKGELAKVEESMEKITREMEEIKNMCKENYNLPEAEKEFFEKNQIE